MLNRAEWNPTALYKVLLLHLPLLILHSSHPHSSSSTHHTLFIHHPSHPHSLSSHPSHPPHPPPITPSLHLPVLSRLQSVCSVVLHFDPSLMVLVWRGMGRLLCRVRQELPESWSIQPIITELCITMETKCAACVQCAPIAENEVTPLSPSPHHPLTLTLAHVLQAPSAVFSKLLRVCRFLGTLVVKLTQAGRGREEEGRGGGESRNHDY